MKKMATMFSAACVFVFAAAAQNARSKPPKMPDPVSISGTVKDAGSGSSAAVVLSGNDGKEYEIIVMKGPQGHAGKDMPHDGKKPVTEDEIKALVGKDVKMTGYFMKPMVDKAPKDMPENGKKPENMPDIKENSFAVMFYEVN